MASMKGVFSNVEQWGFRAQNELAIKDLHFQPVISKLQSISEEYEKLKSDHERQMFEQLVGQKNETQKNILSADANKRQCIKYLSDFLDIFEGIVRDGIQTRRDAEKKFAQNLLETMRSEMDHILYEMRIDDKRKLNFEREENRKKLEVCRTAMEMDVAAKMLQLKSGLERKNVEEMEAMKNKIAELQSASDRETQSLKFKLKEADEKIKFCLMDKKMSLSKMETEIEDLKSQMKELKVEKTNLLKQKRSTERSLKSLQDDNKILKEELQTLEEKHETELETYMNDLKTREDEIDAEREKLKEKSKSMTKVMENLRNELIEITQERDELKAHNDQLITELQIAASQLQSKVSEMQDQDRENKSRMSLLENEISNLRVKEEKSSEELAQMKARMLSHTQSMTQIQQELDSFAEEKASITTQLGNVQKDLKTWIHDLNCLETGREADIDLTGSLEELGDDLSIESNVWMTLKDIGRGAFDGKYYKSSIRSNVISKLSNAMEKKSMSVPVVTKSTQTDGETGKSEQIVTMNTAENFKGNTKGIQEEKAVQTEVLDTTTAHFTGHKVSVIHEEKFVQTENGKANKFSGAKAEVGYHLADCQSFDRESQTSGEIYLKESVNETGRKIQRQIAEPQNSELKETEGFLLHTSSTVKTGKDDSSIDKEHNGIGQNGSDLLREQLEQMKEENLELKKKLKDHDKTYNEEIQKFKSDWQTKCLSLAKRLELAEESLTRPRQEDMKRIKELETQVNSLMNALEEAARVKAVDRKMENKEMTRRVKTSMGHINGDDIGEHQTSGRRSVNSLDRKLYQYSQTARSTKLSSR
uniref:Uncharacterized protein n=2 Tax=Guillardia theta TaxID=55529 RepID=A0A7S4NYK7_GUITH|mmetsp:Transcript_37580/g.118623  ORF Transcript_37580/g.118623 Transcript_37580/m.118623 type:complete len:818 (+) Transcript_37580:201-2654(+)